MRRAHDSTGGVHDDAIQSRHVRPDRNDAVTGIKQSGDTRSSEQGHVAIDLSHRKSATDGHRFVKITSESTSVSRPVFRPVEQALADQLDSDNTGSCHDDRRLAASWHTEDNPDYPDDEFAALGSDRTGSGLRTPGRESLLCTSDDEVSEDDGRYSDISDSEPAVARQRVARDVTDTASPQSSPALVAEKMSSTSPSNRVNSETEKIHEHPTEARGSTVMTRQHTEESVDDPPLYSGFNVGMSAMEISNVSSTYSRQSQDDEKLSIAGNSSKHLAAIAVGPASTTSATAKFVVEDEETDDSSDVQLIKSSSIEPDIPKEHYLSRNTVQNVAGAPSYESDTLCQVRDSPKLIPDSIPHNTSDILVSHPSREHTSSPEPTSIPSFPRSRDSSIKWRPPVRRHVACGLRDPSRRSVRTASGNGLPNRQCAPASGGARHVSGFGFRRSDFAQELSQLPKSGASAVDTSSQAESCQSSSFSNEQSIHGTSQRSHEGLDFRREALEASPGSGASRHVGFGRKAIRRLTRRFAQANGDKNHQQHAFSTSAGPSAAHYGSSHSLLSYLHSSSSSNYSFPGGPQCTSRSFSQAPPDKNGDGTTRVLVGGTSVVEREVRGIPGLRPTNFPLQSYSPFDEYMSSVTPPSGDLDPYRHTPGDAYGVRPEPHSFGGWRSRPYYTTDTSSVGSSDCGDQRNLSQNASLRRGSRGAKPSVFHP